MAEIKKVMISSTSIDLPDHRREILEACQLQKMFAERMEDLPGHAATAAAASLMMVDEADIYIGVFAHRYGYVPADDNPDKISITQMEYNRAVEREIPRLIFVMDKKHPVTFDDVEQGEGGIKLVSFLERVKKENIVNFFVSSIDLRAKVINSLAREKAEMTKKSSLAEPRPDPDTFHYVTDIPSPPEEYIAHPYILQQTPSLIGRREELRLLTDWISNPDSEIYRARILSVVAIGGMGKSALTWKWFNEVASEEMKPLAGRFWWSFYESDGSFENFVMRSLAYVSRRSLEEVRQISNPDRESLLIAALDKEPYVVVLDGLERLLTAYARADATRLKDSEIEENTNSRKTADPRVGAFLKKLSGVRNSRILISTRLRPVELETVAGRDLPGCYSIDIEGLNDEDAVKFWRAFGVSGSQSTLLPIFNSFDKHPLLIQALAGEVSGSYKASGNFDKWREANPQFDPTQFAVLQDAMGHVLETALGGLDEITYKVLYTIAAFRMPAQYDTLASILTGDEKAFRSHSELDEALRELDYRGLIGWDKSASRFDLHPIVRGVVWNRLGSDTRHGVYKDLRTHFEALPVRRQDEIKSLDDLTPAFELYNILIGLRLYDEAWIFFTWRLQEITNERLCGHRQRIELIEMLFPDGLHHPPRLNSKHQQAEAINALALSYSTTGRLKEGTQFFQRSNLICSETKHESLLAIGLNNLSINLRCGGKFFESEAVQYRGLILSRQLKQIVMEPRLLDKLGTSLGLRGLLSFSNLCLQRALRILATHSELMDEILVNVSLSLTTRYGGDYESASRYATRALSIASSLNYEPFFIYVSIAEGEAALNSDNLVEANEVLHQALLRARKVSYIEEELPALIALAELRRRQGDEKAAREFLNDVWEYAERGPYPLFHADALNVLAQIERDAGNTDAAKEAATKAYQLSWCDGPPYAYHWGLVKAEKHLEELGAPLPDMPPFDESKFEPMPEVEIDPDDEFHVGDQE